ncbi:RepB family plasmid replication initiator protein [Halospina sp. K52047b]|uniref:RepB family plasmid replication initiator protein n=1 Tax=Halospina sp. K52047b TaxID=2614160 RepID=UPI00124A8FF4|nr:RepB family plasmid replication initiator protein [Halospina sp. K52047b]KAA8976709.1 replication initiation protein [Halospina sp. K52047b]
MSEQLVVKSNALVEAGHRLSLAEQRIVLAAITQIRRDRKPDSEAWYEVTADALSEVSGISASRAYHDLANAIETLWERDITVRGGPNGNDRTTKGGRVMKARWIQAVEYVPDEGKIRLMFSAPIVPYLTVLKKQFTRYQLRFVAPMRSRFGPRLYELLQQWRQSGERELALDDLQSMWGTAYTRVYDLKRFVIAPAVKDVNTHSDLEVSVGYRKTGRRVTHVQLKFSPKAGLESLEEAQKPRKKKGRKLDESFANYVKRNARPGESWEAAKIRLGV